jgi:hypothetical protein
MSQKLGKNKNPLYKRRVFVAGRMRLQNYTRKLTGKHFNNVSDLIDGLHAKNAGN